MNFLLYDLNIIKYFPDVNVDYLMLAITPGKGYSHKKLIDKYNIHKDLNGNKTHKVFEFYGDVALDCIVSSELMDMFDLNITNGLLTKIKSSIVSNFTLTYLATELGICWNIFNINYDSEHISMDRLKNAKDKHTVCGNSIEGIIGALYYQYGMEKLNIIRNWFFSLKGVYEYFNDMSCKYNTLNTYKFPSLVFGGEKHTIDFINNYEYYYPQYKFSFINLGDILGVDITRKNCSIQRIINLQNTKDKFKVLRDELQRINIWIPY